MLRKSRYEKLSVQALRWHETQRGEEHKMKTGAQNQEADVFRLSKIQEHWLPQVVEGLIGKKLNRTF